MKNGVALADLTDDDPMGEFVYLIVFLVGIHGMNRSGLEADWAHIVVMAVVYVCLVFGLQTLAKIRQGGFAVFTESFSFSV